MLVLTQIFSLIGSRITGIAVSIRIFQDTGNTAPLLMLSFLSGEFDGGICAAQLVIDNWARSRLTLTVCIDM